MPFDAYLKDYSPDTDAVGGDSRDKDTMGSAGASTSSSESNITGMDSSTFSGGIQFQMPLFLLPSANGSMLGSDGFPPGFFHGGSPSYYNPSLWTQPSLDKSKTSVNSKTYVVFVFFTTF